ncbi:cytochrome P450 [Byssothecium circinans]|uniref:Cytochrome P450 n=1 Tax=Byssothecium circinans TaxID=147558 RepID=A0A6A5UCN1_9PLEO|nr:cytochrome P450 [Byssothecium circinans]
MQLALSPISMLNWSSRFQMDSREIMVTFLQAILMGCLSWIVAKYTYNVYFHALREFPGPAFAAASYIPWFYHRARGNSRHWHKQLHERYGDVVRTGPAFLSFTHPQAWTDIYRHRGSAHRTYGKDWRFYTKPRRAGEYNINTIPTDEQHGKVRRVFASAFSDRALKLQEPLISRHIDKVIYSITQHITQRPADAINIVQIYNYMAFDIMSDLAFGQGTGMLDGGHPSPWLEMVYRYVKATNLLARLARGREEPDIWNLIDTSGEGLLTKGQIHANAAVFMSAGTETIATQLSGVTYLLLSHPAKLRKLAQEIRSFDNVEDLSLQQLATLPYLNACLKEGLRLYPPIAEGLPRRIPDTGGAVLGHALQPGTSIYVSPYATNRSSTNFHRPDSFEPERWLSRERHNEDRREALQPFSTGPRDCLGKSLAYHEMRLAVARVIYYFDLKLQDSGQDWIAKQKTYVIWEKLPLWLQVSAVPRVDQSR